VTYEVRTQGNGGNPRHSLGSVARYRDVLAVCNYDSKTVTLFTRSITHNTFVFVKLIRIVGRPVSVTFSDNHMYVLSDNHVESFVNIQGQVTSTRDGMTGLALSDSSAIQVLYQRTNAYRNPYARNYSYPRQLLYITEVGYLNPGGFSKEGEVSHVDLDDTGKIYTQNPTHLKSEAIGQLSNEPVGSFPDYPSGNFLINPGGLARNPSDRFSNQVYITVLNRNQTVVIRNLPGETYVNGKLSVTNDDYMIGAHFGGCPEVEPTDNKRSVAKSGKRATTLDVDYQPWGVAAFSTWLYVAHPNNHVITTYNTYGSRFSCYDIPAASWDVSIGEYTKPYELTSVDSTYGQELAVWALTPITYNSGVSTMVVYKINQDGELQLKFSLSLPSSASWNSDDSSRVGARGIAIFPGFDAGSTDGYY